jgi:regulator of replication initiation timing
MSPETDGTPSGTEGTPGGNQSTTGTPPAKEPVSAKVTELQSKLTEANERYIGLQRTLQETKDAQKALSDSLTSTQTELQALKLEKDNLQVKVTETEALFSEKDMKIDELTRKTHRSDLIFKDYPELAPFEAEGLLPEVEDDVKLPEVFGKFREKLGTLQAKAKTDHVVGGTPPPPDAKPKSEPGSDNIKILLDEVNKAALTGNAKSYKEAYGKYMAAKEAKAREK